MLTVLMDASKSDSLDLLAPYVKFVLGEHYSRGSSIAPGFVKTELQQKNGFRLIPEKVIIKLLKRFEKQGMVSYAEGKFTLIKTFTAERTEFLRQRAMVDSETSAVLDALKAYINEHPIRSKEIDDAKAIEILETFLKEKGYVTLENFEQLAHTDESALPYLFPTAQFILAARENDSQLFEKIMRVVRGFMLSKVIYAQQTLQLKGKKFSALDVYLDTRLILNAFGYNGKAEKESVSSMLELLVRGGAHLKCFTHTYQEVYNIIFAYKESLRDHRNRSVYTLQHFDEQNYRVFDVEFVLSKLDATFEQHGISVVPLPDYPASDFSWSIGENDLKETLNQQIKYRKNAKGEKPALDNDVASVAAITRIRQGVDFEEIGSCKAIFVSSNYELVNSANRYLSTIYESANSANKKRNTVPFVIDDVELTTVTWLRSESAAQSTDVSTLTLIANARASLELTSEMIDAFVNRVNILQSNGEVSDDEAKNIIYMLYRNRENLMQAFNGDAHHMEQATAVEIRAAAMQFYTPELLRQLEESNSERDSESERNELLTRENERLRAENARILADRQKVEDERNKASKEKQGRIRKAQAVAEDSKKSVVKVCRLICIIFAVLIAIASTVYLISEFIENRQSNKFAVQTIIGMFVLLLDTLGAIDTLRDKGVFVGRLIRVLGQKRYKRVYNRVIGEASDDGTL